jgi:uncharacterized BrkB/YihY/UPF0761 family membrane protein
LFVFACGWSRVLATQTQLGNNLAVTLDVATFDVVEKTTTTTDHHQQSTTTVVVVLVSLEVFGEMINALRQESNLHFRRTGVGAMSTVFGNGFNLGDASYG